MSNSFSGKCCKETRGASSVHFAEMEQAFDREKVDGIGWQGAVFPAISIPLEDSRNTSGNGSMRFLCYLQLIEKIQY